MAKKTSNEFKIDFNPRSYIDIYPDINQYLKNDFILNERDWGKGELQDCIWKNIKPSFKEVESEEFQKREAMRVLRTGVWIYIKHELVWIPPQYYFSLRFMRPGGEDMQFRLKRLKHKYHKIRARNNPQCKGTLTVKNRQDGETTDAIADALWETFDMDMGQIGIISKTRDDAINPCWMTLQSLWMNLPKWFKDLICPDFASGKNIAESMKWMREADAEKGITARNVLMTYYPSVYNAMDGKSDMKRALVDECLKWVECNFGDYLENASKFIMPGFERRGIFDIFSSPPEKESQSYKDGYELWLNSNPDEIDPDTGTTKSRIHRYYSNPLEGIHGAYDRWGDANPEQIMDWIQKERKSKPKSKRLNEIRGFPLNEEEIWGSLEAGGLWDNSAGIEERKIYLIGKRVSGYDESKGELKVLYGNLDWEDGAIDSGDIIFKATDKEEFDAGDSRFAIAGLPQHFEAKRPKLLDPKVPPRIVGDVMGVDSVDRRYPGTSKVASNVAMVNYRFLDLYQLGLPINCPTLIYSNRPQPVEVAYEDAIKAAIYNRSMVQVESINLNIVNHFEDRGYMKWLLAKRGENPNSFRKGDAPSGKTAFLDEIVSLINSHTGVWADPNKKCYLENHWFYELLEDLNNFNKKDTHKNDLTMAFGQALIGMIKLTRTKKAFDPHVSEAILESLFG